MFACKDDNGHTQEQLAIHMKAPGIEAQKYSNSK